MPEARLIAAISAALRMHEIGTKSPYQLYFAAKGKSGGSFGFMQGDLAAGQDIVTKTFRQILADADASKADIQRYLDKLSVHLIGNPLSSADTKFVNNALKTGSAKVDAMDQAIAADVYSDLDKCIEAAAKAHRKISAKALLYAALWINMSGHPSKLLTWLKGDDPHLQHPLPKPPQFVGGSDMRGYLMATDYYTSNPGNAAHLDQSVQAGALLLPADA
ncbi:hypothetical protein [Mesorhizobium sp.]|uniref:hypothetical protein n=1 Tax=Mesorhizobium sp. TaxID=1871066 RepID=UPI000FE9F56E|nr:hypothetical protein [Mesorhizobium sp.]RWA63873.1 MAG: hypothetical protein EOQ29_28945 [Mesorhizobium sp.]RWE00467.1 MAG: hypothetical protein EOS40_15370 [Mesorhizobium sp.]